MATTTTTIDREFDIILEPERDPDDIGAEPKFQIRNTNVGDGGDGKGLIDVDIGGDALIVKCDLAQVVHGFMFEDQPATLAVFQFAFVPRGNFRRVKEAEITITFSAGDVEAIAPSETWAISKSETQREVSHSVNPSLEVAYGPAKAGVGYTWQLTKTDMVADQARVEGVTRALGHGFSLNRRKRRNTVFWGLYENKATGSAIPSFMQAVVLLRRNEVQGDPLGERFSAEINISGKADRYTNLKDKLDRFGRTLSGRNVKGEDIMFDPAKSRASTVKDLRNLQDEDLEAYKSLITIRDWVDGNPKPAPEAAALVNPTDQSTGALISDPKSAEKAVPVVPAAIPPAATAAEATSKPETPKNLGTGSGGDVAQKIAELRDRLSTVRIEANLLRRLLFLEEEERNIVQEIIKLESIGPKV